MKNCSILPKCNGSEKLQNFLTVATEVYKDTDLIQHCLKPKCETKEWFTKSDQQYVTKDLNGNNTIMEYDIVPNSMLEEKTETLLYSPINLLADFGGYLGLFLGGSILSLLDGLLNVFTACLKTRMNKNEML